MAKQWSIPGGWLDGGTVEDTFLPPATPISLKFTQLQFHPDPITMTTTAPISPRRRSSNVSLSGGSGGLLSDPALQVLYTQMYLSSNTSLLTEWTKTMSRDSVPLPLRMELELMNLNRPVKEGAHKASPSVHLLQDQLRAIEETHKQEVAVWEDMQEFLKMRARADIEYAQNVQRIAHHFAMKRKYPEKMFKEGHTNILLSDLFQQFLDSANDEFANRHKNAERILKNAGDQMETQLEEKKSNFRVAMRILGSLQEQMFVQEQNVIKTKKMYESAMKELVSFQKKKSNRKKLDYSARVASLESKSTSLRNEYLMELACANSIYGKFKDRQMPEVVDTMKERSIDWFKSFMTINLDLQQSVVQEQMDVLKILKHNTSLLNATFDRRMFLHSARKQFPGRQLFEFEPSHNDEVARVVVTDKTRIILSQTRHLLQHHTQNIESQLDTKDEQLESLLQLYTHYTKAGSVLHKSQNQANAMRSKMLELSTEMNAIACEHEALAAKIKFLTTVLKDCPSTRASIDEGNTSMMTHPGTPTKPIDIAEAQEREAERRMKQIESVDLEAVRQDALDAAEFLLETAGEDALDSHVWDAPAEEECSTPSSSTSKLKRAFGFGKKKNGSLRSTRGIPGLSSRSDSTTTLNAVPSTPGAPSPLASFDSTAPPPPPPPPMANGAPPPPPTSALIPPAPAPQTVSTAPTPPPPPPPAMPSSASPMLSTSPIPPPPPPPAAGFHSQPTTPCITPTATPARASISVPPPPQSADPNDSEDEEDEATMSPFALALKKKKKTLSVSPTPTSTQNTGTSAPVASTTPSRKTSIAAPMSMASALGDALSRRRSKVDQQLSSTAAPPAPPVPSPNGASVPPPPPPMPPAASLMTGPPPTSKPPIAPPSSKPPAAPPAPTPASFAPPPPPPPPPPSSLTAAPRAPPAPPTPMAAPPPPPPMFSEAPQAPSPPSYPTFEEQQKALPLCRAQYAYTATQQDDISLADKEVLYELVRRDDGWSLGLNMHGQVGYFPTAYATSLTTAASKFPCVQGRIIKVSTEAPDVVSCRFTGSTPVVVDAVDAGSSMAAAGLKQGDLVLKVNDTHCAAKTLEVVNKLITEAKGSEALELLVLNKNEMLERVTKLNAISKRPSFLSLV
eukprot:m.172188 g.172188  ORF g.172188 m.172188 type:complete len:1133 (+) comp14572_c0_seq2:141-3539(+)